MAANAMRRDGNATLWSSARWDLACVGLVLAGRLLVLLGARQDPAFRIPYLDGAFYHTWARSLLLGHGDFQGPYFLGPLYPYFLALIYRIGGPDPWIARVLQSAFGVLDAALVLVIGRRIFGAGPARAAAVLFALYGPEVFYENLLVMESLVTTLALAALGVAVVPRGRELVRAALSGALLGLASLGRPTALVAVPAVLFAMHETRPKTARGWRRAVAACVAACLLVLLPVLVRNTRLGAVAITTNGGVNLYAGNNPEANGRFHEPPGVRFFRDPILDSASKESLPPAVAARALTVRAAAGTDEAADSGLWTRRALAWIVSKPFDAVKLVLRKAWLVLQAREIAQIESYDFHARRLGVLHPFRVDFGWLWPLAFLGLWRARRERTSGWRGVALFGAAMLVPCIVFFVTGRYRLGSLPAVVLFAGAGAWALVGWARRREISRAAVALVAIAPVAVLARLGARPPAGALGWESAQMAERLYAAGDVSAAIQYQEVAARTLSERWEPALNLALYRSERDHPGDLDQAVASLQVLARRWPRQPIVQYNLGLLLQLQGRMEEARGAFAAALAADPRFEPARSRLLQTGPRTQPPAGGSSPAPGPTSPGARPPGASPPPRP